MFSTRFLFSSKANSFFIPPTAKIAASGGFTIAVNSEIPIIPKLEMLNVFPCISSGIIFLVFALTTKSLDSTAI